MSNEQKTIHDFDLNLICEYYSNFERQGPGSPEITAKALSFIDNLTDEAQIADIGCGTGGQTFSLARLTEGQITAVDLFPRFIDMLNQNAQKQGLAQRLKGVATSMDNLPFENEHFDLLWSEGAIYNIGFEDGLKLWRKFLKPGGYIAVSEASWFTNERPAEIEDFWKESYPGIDTIAVKTGQMMQAGYAPIATFILPDHCWTEHFYAPQAAVQEMYLNRFKGNMAVEEFIACEQHEAWLFNKYKQYYGYAFYIGKKL